MKQKPNSVTVSAATSICGFMRNQNETILVYFYSSKYVNAKLFIPLNIPLNQYCFVPEFYYTVFCNTALRHCMIEFTLITALTLLCS